jgi:TonB family protein
MKSLSTNLSKKLSTNMAKDLSTYLSRTKKRALGLVALSLAVHLALSTVAWISGALHPKKTPVVQAAMKFYPAALFLPGGTHALPSKQPPGRIKAAPAPKRMSTDLAMNEKPAPPKGHLVAADHAPMAGNGTDTASADPAFPIFSPQPAVTDRALLPQTDKQVIVDVKVSAAGDVLEATLVSGIGNALDALVLTTVKTWRFHPAMMNGNPVPTEAELIFPFSERTMMAPS